MTTIRNALVLLDGSASRDPDGDTLNYAWTIDSRPAGSAVTLSNPGSVRASFVADLPGSYAVSLVVTDGKTSSTPASVAILALPSISHIHDTGQTQCYGANSESACPAAGSPFFGQDAQYSTNPMLFVDDGTTVTDDLTGLTWQRSDSGTTYNWYQAAGVYNATYNPSSIDICGALSLGGFADWRLPSRREWVSIVNYAIEYCSLGAGPDQPHFPSAGNPCATQYWTSSASAGSSNVAWGSDGGDMTYDSKGTSARYVRCVRGAAWGRNSFFDNGDGTVRDQTSGLVWQKNDDGVARTWEGALAYCESLALAGSLDWRLPDVKELESLVQLSSSDATPYMPAIDTSRFPTTQTSYYWSSTSFGGSGYAWGVDFSDGWVSPWVTPKTDYRFTRCVR